MRKLLLTALGAFLGAAGLVYAAGIATNGLPTTSSALTGVETMAADTNLSGGQYPQTESVTTRQVSAWGEYPTALTDAATIAVDASDGNYFTVTLGGNRTLAVPSNMTTGQMLSFRIAQDGTGSRTLAYASGYRFSGGTTPTLTTTASRVDVLTFLYDGTYMLGLSAVLNYIP